MHSKRGLMQLYQRWGGETSANKHLRHCLSSEHGCKQEVTHVWCAHLFQFEGVLIKVVLEPLIGKVDAELFKAVVLVVLKTKNVQYTDGQDLQDHKMLVWIQLTTEIHQLISKTRFFFSLPLFCIEELGRYTRYWSPNNHSRFTSGLTLRPY